MTIAKRLIISARRAARGAGGARRLHPASTVEDRGPAAGLWRRTQIPSLAVLGNLSRTVEELRVNVRSHLLATNQAEQAKARSAFDAGEAEVNRLLGQYGDSLVTGDQDRRLFNDYRDSSRDYIAGAKQVDGVGGGGTPAKRPSPCSTARWRRLGGRLSKVSSEWIQHNEDLATTAGKAAVEAIEAVAVENAHRQLRGHPADRPAGLPDLPADRQADPSAGSIGEGHCRGRLREGSSFHRRPRTKPAAWRARLTSSSKAPPRWTSSAGSSPTPPSSPGELQGAASLAEFGQRLVSGLVPMLGGGVAGFYLFEENPGRLRRIAAYGLAEGAAPPTRSRLGEGLVGQCAQERKAVTLDQSAAGLSADRLRLWAALRRSRRWRRRCCPRTHLLGVLEFATFRAFNSQETGAARGIAAGGGDEPGDLAAQPPHAGTARADAGTGPPTRGADGRADAIAGGIAGAEGGAADAAARADHAAGAAQGQRRALAAHPRIQRRGHLRHGHRGTNHVREPGRLPDARIRRRGTDRPAFPRRLPPPPARRQRVSEGRMPDVRRLQARQGQPH